MKAAVRYQYGPPEILRVEELDRPQPKAGEVLIRVEATTVNRSDIAILTGKPWIMRLFTGLFRPGKIVPGTDFCGIVEEVGSEVSKFKAGDKVWGFGDNGIASQAQYMCYPEKGHIDLMPDTLPFQEAVACLEGAHYAYNFINKVKVEPGQKVLINGATGAIGSALLQIAKHYGCTVTAVGNTKNLDLLRELGAERVIDYQTTDFTQDSETYHFVFDAVGKSTFGKCKPILKKGGVYISSELGPNGQNPILALTTQITGDKKVKFPLPLNVLASMRFVKALISGGEFKPVIDRTYPLEQIAEAYTYVASGQKTGNVVIRYTGDV